MGAFAKSSTRPRKQRARTYQRVFRLRAPCASSRARRRSANRPCRRARSSASRSIRSTARSPIPGARRSPPRTGLPRRSAFAARSPASVERTLCSVREARLPTRTGLDLQPGHVGGCVVMGHLRRHLLEILDPLLERFQDRRLGGRNRGLVSRDFLGQGGLGAGLAPVARRRPRLRIRISGIDRFGGVSKVHALQAGKWSTPRSRAGPRWRAPGWRVAAAREPPDRASAPP